MVVFLVHTVSILEAEGEGSETSSGSVPEGRASPRIRNPPSVHYGSGNSAGRSFYPKRNPHFFGGRGDPQQCFL